MPGSHRSAMTAASVTRVATHLAKHWYFSSYQIETNSRECLERVACEFHLKL